MNLIRWCPAQKIKNASRRPEKRRVDRGVRRTNSLATVERKQGLLWVLTISFFVVRTSACILLCESHGFGSAFVSSHISNKNVTVHNHGKLWNGPSHFWCSTDLNKTRVTSKINLEQTVILEWKKVFLRKVVQSPPWSKILYYFPLLYGSVSQGLPNSRILLAEMDIDRGLTNIFPSRLASTPVMFWIEKVAS